jgi:crotonobetainyl-CoA:carnitine CoA-transferase CaiB-like acyl-CoA transferase
MSSPTLSLARSMWSALAGDPEALQRLDIVGAGDLPSCFHVSGFAAAAIGAAALSVGELIGRNADFPAVTVDRRLASLWFGATVQPVGWELPAARDPLTGDYPARDGWIRLHTNAPHHRAAAERVLGRHSDAADTAQAVAGWAKGALEAAVVAAGGCAAEMRSTAEWLAHPQGRAVGGEPLIAFEHRRDVTARASRAPSPSRPLAGLRVLDLTRVLAGPVATRFLAAFGAQVLRVDPPGWDEPGVAPEVTLGKRCARLDLKSAAGRACFEELLTGADVLIHGYRPQALERLGYGETRRFALSPGIIDLTLDAYGWSGPWAGRRGFDSLVQMSAGIAAAGMRWRGAEKPVPLPVQALDHATGYLLAAAAARGLAMRSRTACGLSARLSLARTAKALLDAGTAERQSAFEPPSSAEFNPVIESTSWGEAHRLLPPARVSGAPMKWTRGACALGSAAPRWEE